MTTPYRKPRMNLIGKICFWLLGAMAFNEAVAQTVQYGYDSQGRLSTVTYADGASRTYLYENTSFPNALTGVVDESTNRYSTWGYDSQGRATSTSEAGGANSNTLVYNSDGSVTVTDALGAVRTFTFGRYGDLNLTTGISGSQCPTCQEAKATTYDLAGFVSSRTDYNNNVAQYTYDDVRGLETSRTEASGTARARTITTQWHSTYRLPMQIAVYNGGTATGTPVQLVSFTYDSAGNLLTRTMTDTSVTPNVSRTWTYTYNSYGQVLTEDGPRTDVSDVTTYTYYTCTTGSECGQLHTVTNALNQTTAYNTYNTFGQPLTITDPNGVVTTLTYDLRQRLASSTVGSEIISFEYWPTGLLKKVIQPDSSYLLYTYDNAHRLVKVEDGIGNRIEYTLDAMGNRTAQNIYDPSSTLNRTHTQVFNTLNQLWKDIGAANTAAVTTQFGYDSNGSQITIAAPLGRNTVNQYDELNRLKQVTDPANGITKLGYDATDNLTSVIDPRNLTTGYTYNGFGEVVQLTSPDTGTTVSTYVAGNLATVTNARGNTAIYGHDALNRLNSITYPDQTIGFSYDAGTNGKGRLTGASDANHSLAWTYDAHGRVAGKIQTVGTNVLNVGYAYNSAGQLSTLTTPSGQVIGFSYTNNQVAGMTINGSSLVSQVSYSPFGPARQWQWGNGTTAVRTFDTDGRITAVNSAGTLSYSYYADNTIHTATRDTPAAYSTLSGATTLSYSGGSNRFSSTSGAMARSYSHDNTGNVTNDGSRSFTYNAAGRMTTATAGGVTTSYLYNALGERIRKSNSGGTTYFVYDEVGHLIGEYDGSLQLIEEIVWLGDIPVASIRPAQGGTVGVFYIHTDLLNSPAKLTRANDNVQVWRWDHDPYGNGAAIEDADGNGQRVVFNLRYPGQYYDSETGLAYSYQRDGYDAQTGRFTQSDPIGLRGGSFSTYSYASANPIMVSDPTGLRVEVIGHVAAAPLGRITSPTSYHSALYLKPDDPCHCSGTWPVTLGAQDIGGTLVGAPNYPGDASSNAQFRQVVRAPAGMSDCDFIRSLISAAASYQSNLPYSFPSIPSGAMSPGKYNSNSFVSGVLRSIGATPPSINTGGQFQLPGYQNPIPLPPQN